MRPGATVRALATLGRAIELMNRAAMAVSAAGVLVSLALIGWAVVMRYAFNRPPVWVDDTVGFMLVGIVVLAASQSLRRGEHIGVDVFVAGLSARARRWAEGWAWVSVLAVSLIFIVNGWQTAMFARQLGILTEGNVEIPLYLLQLLLPLGGVMMLLVSIEGLLRLAAGVPSLAAPTHRGETLE